MKTSFSRIKVRPHLKCTKKKLSIVLIVFVNILQFLTTNLQYVAAVPTTTTRTMITTTNKLQAFNDLMDLQKIKHGIIVVDGIREKFRKSTRNKLNELLSVKRLQFYEKKRINNGQMRFLEMFSEKKPRVAVFADNMEDNSTKDMIFKPASANGLFNYTQIWFIASSINYYEDFDYQQHIRNIFDDYKIYVNADVTIAFKSANYSLQLFDIYRIHNEPTTALQIENKGQWDVVNGLLMPTKFTLPFMKRRHNFGGIEIKAGVVMREKPDGMDTLEYLRNNRDFMHIEPYVRKSYQLMEILGPLYNFTLGIVITPDWSSYNNGSWNGIIAVLNEQQAEFAACPTRITIHRAQYARFTSEMHRECMRFIFRHPRRAAVRNIFFEPFANEVWWSVLIMTILTILLLTLNVRQEFEKQSQCSGTHHIPIQSAEPIESRFDFIVLRALEAVFMQGPSPDIFTLISTRILFTAVSVFSVLLLQFYSGFIVGSLVSVPPRTITTPEALYKSNLQIGSEGVAFNRDALKNSSDAYSRALYFKRIMSDPQKNVVPMETGLDRVKSGGFAYHIGVDSAYRFLEKIMGSEEFCELQTIVAAACLRSASATLRNSSIREYIAIGILHFRNTGIMDHIERLWRVELPDCSLNEQKQIAVDLEHFAPALVFLSVALIASGIVLLLELLANCWQRRQHLFMRNVIGSTIINNRENIFS